MKRGVDELRDRSFDLVVVGGGIYGSWIAYDAQLRGLKVALIERDDWSCGASSRSSKLIHGGLRYLEQYEFRLVRKTLEERERLVQLAPHRVQRLRFALPIYKGARVGRFQLKLGLSLYDFLGHTQSAVRHESIPRSEFLERYPFLTEDALTSGFTYPDAQTDDARMVIEIVDGACRAGAVVANRVEATGNLHRDGVICGVTARDRLADESFEIRSEAVIHCTGPWMRNIPTEGTPNYRTTKGAHLLLPALPTQDAFLLPSDSDRRIVFLIPWYGRTMLGTTDTDYDGDPSAVRCEPEDERYLLDVANRYLREPWSPEQVLGRFAGLRVLPALEPGVSPSDVSREWRLFEPEPGLFTMIGGKYTGARADAAHAVDRIGARLPKQLAECVTGDRPLPWAPSTPFESWLTETVQQGTDLGLDAPTARQAAMRHGSRIVELFDLIREKPESAERVTPSLPFCMAELRLAASTEMAHSLGDLLCRRIPLQLLEPLERATLVRCAESIAALLGWDAARVSREVAETAAL